jgi:hypothetical protein
MNYTGDILKTYAESGLRTVEAWVSLGRDITADAKPRVDTTLRGSAVSLYSRDQTHPRPPANSKR